MDLARSIASRFTRSGESSADLRQVAYLGLVAAASRYDADRGTDFAAFAAVTIKGTLKRHLRDLAWSTRVPRRVKELTRAVQRQDEEMTQRLGRSPSVDELASTLQTLPGEIRDARRASRSFRAYSLDAPTDGEGSMNLGDVVGARHDDGFRRVEDVMTAGPAIATLPPRLRRVLHLHFVEGRSQREVGERLGVSQVQVSRLLRRAVEEVRRKAGVSPP